MKTKLYTSSNLDQARLFGGELSAAPSQPVIPGYSAGYSGVDQFVGPAAARTAQARPRSPEALELQQKMERLIKERFGGDPKRAFDHYDRNKDGKLDRSELKSALKDARVGSGLSRGLWVSGILKALDTNRNEALDRQEFLGILSQRT